MKVGKIAAGAALFAIATALAACSPREKAIEEDAKPAAAAPAFRIVAEFDRRPGNPAISPDGRIFVTMHPFDAPDFALLEVKADGSSAPFPDAAFAGKRKTAQGPGIQAAIGIEAGGDDWLWTLDLGDAAYPPRLFGYHLKDKKAQFIDIPKAVLKPNSFLQDFAYDSARQTFYIADMTSVLAEGASPAIIVLDASSPKAPKARRVLDNAPILQAEGDPFLVEGLELTFPDAKGVRQKAAPALNPIAYDAAGDAVFFGAMRGKWIYRLPGEVLRNPAADPAELEKSSVKVLAKPFSDGFALANGGVVYMGDLERGGIGVSDPLNGYKHLTGDWADLPWVDGLAFGPDGTLYATINELNRAAILNDGKDGSKGVRKLVALKP